MYLTEWGWNSNGANETCVASECVSERALALYAVRGAFVLARLVLDRLTWFFYANDAKCNTLFCRSGVTSSSNTGFVPKRSFIALQALVKTLGSRQFVKVLREDSTSWIYVLGDANGKATHLIAWRPVDGDDSTTTTVSLAINDLPDTAWTLAGTSMTGEPAALPTVANGKWNLKLSAVLLVIGLVSGK